MANPKDVDVYVWKLIFCKYITKKGVRIYPQNAKAFRFWVKVKLKG
jgi:hypothetical protein